MVRRGWPFHGSFPCLACQAIGLYPRLSKKNRLRISSALGNCDSNWCAIWNSFPGQPVRSRVVPDAYELFLLRLACHGGVDWKRTLQTLGKVANSRIFRLR